MDNGAIIIETSPFSILHSQLKSPRPLQEGARFAGRGLHRPGSLPRAIAAMVVIAVVVVVVPIMSNGREAMLVLVSLFRRYYKR